MFDLSKLKTSKGAPIVLHFEDKSQLKELIEQGEPVEDVLAGFHKVLEKWSQGFVDTGKDTAHFIIHTNRGIGAILNDAQFAEWEKEEIKNWYHPVGPTAEQIKKYEAIESASSVNFMAQISQACSYCLSNTCRGRHYSFNQEMFEAQLAELTH